MDAKDARLTVVLACPLQVARLTASAGLAGGDVSARWLEYVRYLMGPGWGLPGKGESHV
uniref:Uncharacterized protein n=1 Tax=Thermogemmatispora argillosa TaxID=2045280 RepID=A0A455T3L6_9CHLR|nr:hypothetical protein KTA_12840 [Thermogemmatispora argillosa]